MAGGSIGVVRARARSVKHWSLTALREKLINIGAKVVTPSRYVIFQMAEVAVPHELFAAILDRIQRFGVPPQWDGIMTRFAVFA